MSENSGMGKITKLLCAALGLIATILTLSDRLPTRIETFHSTAYSVSNGDHVTITWRVKGYRSQVFLDGEPVSGDDARDFIIDGPRDFVLTARGTFGEDRRLVQIATYGALKHDAGRHALSPPADSVNQNLATPPASLGQPDSVPRQSTQITPESEVKPSPANSVVDSMAEAQTDTAIKRWLDRFVTAGEGPSAEGLRTFYADTVSPYFAMKSATWVEIQRDKKAYFERFPTIRYTLVGTPRLSSLDNGDRVVEFTLDYSVVRKDGKTSTGRYSNQITLRTIDGSLKAVGIEETKIQ